VAPPSPPRSASGHAACSRSCPRRQLSIPPAPPLLLATPEQNQALIAACGIRQIHVFPFTREFAAMGPAEFLSLLKMEFPNLAEIAVGENFTFGKDRAGNRATLPDLAAAVGLRAQIVPPVAWARALFSTRRARRGEAGTCRWPTPDGPSL
jgi:riboflavin kinase/FMN adenylyltransferase